MMNEARALPYDLTHERLELEPSSLERAPDLEPMDMLQQLLDPDTVSHDATAAHRILDAALALYWVIAKDPAYSDIPRTSLFAAALDTANVWEFG